MGAICRIKPGGLAFVALCCNSFSAMTLGCGCRLPLYGSFRSRGTSQRDAVFPLGNVGYGYVATGNLLCSRVVLLLWLCSSRGVRWILEQPRGSSVGLHPRFRLLQEHVRDAWQKRECALSSLAGRAVVVGK